MYGHSFGNKSPLEKSFPEVSNRRGFFNRMRSDWHNLRGPTERLQEEEKHTSRASMSWLSDEGSSADCWEKAATSHHVNRLLYGGKISWEGGGDTLGYLEDRRKTHRAGRRNNLHMRIQSAPAGFEVRLCEVGAALQDGYQKIEVVSF